LIPFQLSSYHVTRYCINLPVDIASLNDPRKSNVCKKAVDISPQIVSYLLLVILPCVFLVFISLPVDPGFLNATGNTKKRGRSLSHTRYALYR